ncbi:MAG: TolC family protein, partial [Poseidonibacter sp.]
LTSNDKITDVKELKNIKIDNLDFNTLYKNALVNKNDLKMQKINTKIRKKNIEVSNSQFYPSVYSHLEYGFNDDKFTLSNEKDYYNAVIGLKYTIFDNTRNAEKEKKKIQYKKATLDYEKLKDYTKLQLQKVLLEFNSKQKVLKQKKEEVLLANDIYEQSMLMYKNHLIAITNLLEQEANLREKKAQLILAKYEKSLAKANIALISGSNLIEKSIIKKAQK